MCQLLETSLTGKVTCCFTCVLLHCNNAFACASSYELIFFEPHASVHSVVLELSVCLAFQLSWDSLHLRCGDNLPLRLLKQTVAELPCTCEGSGDSFFRGRP